MKIRRSLTALILSFVFLFVVMSLLGGNPVPIARAAPQAAPPVISVLAPQAIIMTPTRNAVGVPLSENLSISFDELILASSVTTRTFVVHGSQSPIFTGVYALNDLSRTIMFDPSRSFFPGEVVNASVTTATLNITGEHVITPTIWQFWAATYGGTGRFMAHLISPTFGTGDSVGIVLGDLDSDSDLDAVIANDTGQAETVWLNDGTGRFAPHPTMPSFGVGDSQDIALGDVDDDGDLDALVANDNGQAETVWLNDGAGSFSAHPTTPSFGTGESDGIALGDVDGDGDLDAVVANYFSDQPETVWLNNGTGVFTPHPDTPSFGAGNSTGIALGDLDSDGDLDALVANYNSQPETVWLNDGNGNFTLHPTSPSFGTGDSQDIILGDLDDDGDLDAIVANYSGEAETVWLNDGTGIFTTHPSTPSFGGGNSTALALGDLDGDSDLDVLVANYFGQAETVWLNDGAGVFVAHPISSTFGVGTSSDIALGDVDGDGDLDTLVANYSDEAETVWLNQDAVADMAITKTASPEPAVAGTTMFYTITVANQGTLTATNVVVSDTLPPSTTLTTVDQIDDDDSVEGGFGGGTHNNTRWNEYRPNAWGDEWLELVDSTSISGEFTSRVMDAGYVGVWTSLTWRPQRPYGKALPNAGVAETSYELGNADMVGNRVLLHLDEASAPFVDSSGLGHNGQCTNCPGTGVSGRFDSALSFDGVDDVVVIPDPADPVRYAIELWVNPTVVTDTSFILRTTNLSETTYSHLLGISDGHFIHQVNDGSGRVVVGTTPIVTGTWYHLVGTAESNGDAKLFVNGQEDGRLNEIGPIWAGGDEYRLGSAYQSGGITTTFFSGLMDEVAVYSRTLSASEVLDHYLRDALRLSFEARSCANPDCSDGTWTGPYTDVSSGLDQEPPTVALSLPENRYFQYRASLVSAYSHDSPRFRWVNVRPDHWIVQAGQGSCDPSWNNFTCALGSIGPSQTVTITFPVYLDPSLLGVITNTAIVTTTSSTITATVTTTVISQVHLDIVKYDDDDDLPEDAPVDPNSNDPVNPNAPLTYTLAVYNGGPSTAWAVTLTDTMPVTVESVTPEESGWACSFAGQTITCTIASLGVYDQHYFIATGTAPIAEGIITNSAGITATGSTVYTNSQLSDVETTTIRYLADLSIEKMAIPDVVDPGANFTYILTVTNHGPAPASNVVITDILPAGLTAAPAGCSGGTTPVCNVLNMPAGAMVVFAVPVNGTPSTGVLVNRAVVSSATYDPDESNNEVTLYTSIRRVADLVIAKTDTPDPVYTGQPLTYTLTVTNIGPAAAGEMTTLAMLENDHPFSIPIGGRARPYRSNMYLSGLEGSIRNMTVTVRGLSHTYPGDLVLLLTGPGGRNAILMANAGGGSDAVDVNLTFNDAGVSLPISGTLSSANLYRPTNYGLSEDLPLPAPTGPYGGSFADFNGGDPNGMWRLYVYDTFYSDGGAIADGWQLEITTITTDTVTLTDTLPSTISNVSVFASAEWDCGLAGWDLACETDYLAVNSPHVFTVTATAPIIAGIITNTAAITSTVADLTPGNNTIAITTTVLPSSDLSIVKTASSNPAPLGTVLTYTLTISNVGMNINLPVTVTDVLPAGATYLQYIAPGWTCTTASNIVTCVAPGMVPGTQSIQIAIRVPSVVGVITNTAAITSTVYDPYPLNNTATITTTITDMAITGLVATNDSPTVIGQPTTFQATVTTGSNVTYLWNFGDGTAPLSGNPVVHTYAAIGTYTAIVTATNSVSVMTATTQAVVVPFYQLHLPIVMRNYASAPDLVVSSINVTSNTVQVVIKNQGPADVPVDVDHEFWVDLYVNPVPPPTLVNHIWQDGRSLQGVVWGVTVDALPSLRAGGTFTVTLGDAYYWPTLSNFLGGLPSGTPIYAQVDSAHTATTVGGVLENHEITGLPYNNISGPVLVP